ncbi:type VI secretion system membrane subunit TssM [Salinibacter sp. 10B]|uniref:type VI secretion system membrane subunit TssM n=1 Tax=Salinibacter sp. 10B TaxID=1923971 RepID=UPI0011B07833|nr:type VI secretion system membrane subunit TssM [Salinibacter sp. 10B]
MLSILKSRYFWTGVGLFLVGALALVVGAWLDWSMVVQLSIVIGVLFIGLVFVIVEFVRANRNAQKIEQSITMQTDGQRQEAGSQKQAEIDELESRLEEAIATLKDSKLGRGRRGENALHALPWYMFVGPPGVGKTTAIKNSGLNFPMGFEGVRGVGGTRNCDWFFSDQAILLDTAGRYMTEKEDEEEWHAFLEMLKDRRKKRPINGVVVGISMEKLVGADPEEIEWHADNVRRRLGELVERLEVRFPVYLVFTKCDLLQGFVDFFGGRPRSEREKIWGATLTSEQRRERTPRSIFEREFDRLYESLIGERDVRLSRSLTPDERRRVYVFPLEFAAAKENLALFVDQLFQENPYQENPEFRGFYFTSGTQEGAPIDRVLQSMAGEEAAEPVVAAEGEENSETKSYFIKNLFTEAIIPDQYRVQQTSRSARRGRLLRWGVGVMSAILLGVFVLFAGQAVVRSQVGFGRIEKAARDAAAVDWEHQSSVSGLESVDHLRSSIVRLERYEEDPPLLRWGFYRGGVLLEPARELFAETMRPLVRKQFQRLERQLRQSKTISGSLQQERRLELREALRAYLLLSEEVQRLTDEQERVFLTSYLTSVATTDSGDVATAQFRQRSGQVEAQIGRYIQQMSQESDPFQAESALIRDVRRMIYRKPTVGNLYAEIKQEGKNSLRPVRLSDVLREGGGAVFFATSPSVSGFFTKRGWNSYVKERIEKEAKHPGKGDWVLGNQPDNVSGELKNEEKIVQQLRARYFRDYASAWKSFLRSAEYRSFERVGETARALHKLGDPFNSPLLYLLARASTETQFAASMAGKAKGQLKKELKARGQAKIRRRTRSTGGLGSPTNEEGKPIHPVTRQFMGLHRLQAEQAANGEASAELTRALKAIGRAGRTLDKVADSQGRATEIAVRVLSGDSELRSGLTAMRNGLAQLDSRARQNLFDQAILEAWETILQTAQQRLEEQWRRKVYRPYQRDLKGRYPFAVSSQDVSLADFERFFHPQNGRVELFEKKELSPFLEEGGREPKTWEGRGLQLSSSVKQFLTDSEQIGTHLFSGGSLQVRFELVPELPKEQGEAPAASQVYIRIHGTSQTYQMGYQPTTTFVWPGDRGARIVLNTRAGSLPPKQKSGVWAWFRLLDDASVDPRSSNEYWLRWVFERGDQYSIVTRYTLRSEKPQRLFSDPMGFFHLTVPKRL